MAAMMGGEARKVLRTLQRWPVAAPSWTGGFVAGLVSALSPNREARRSARRERFVEGWWRWVRQSVDQVDEENAVMDDLELSSLRQGLAGMTRSKVAALLGNPASAFYGHLHSAAPAGAPWQADIWYYPTDLKQRLALAIHFEDDRVSQVERVAGPVD